MVVELAEETKEQAEIVNRHDGAVDDATLLAEIGVSEGTAGFDEENKPSSGATEVKEDIWAAPQPAAGEVANHGATPAVTEAPSATPTVEANIQPIATGIPEALAQKIDSQFMANEDGKVPAEPLSPDLKVPDSPAGLSSTEEAPATNQQIPEFHAQVGADLEAGIAAAEDKLDKRLGGEIPEAQMVVDAEDLTDKFIGKVEKARGLTIEEEVSSVKEKVLDQIKEIDNIKNRISDKIEENQRQRQEEVAQLDTQITETQKILMGLDEQKKGIDSKYDPEIQKLNEHLATLDEMQKLMKMRMPDFKTKSE